MADLYLYLDDERKPMDRWPTKKGQVTVIRSYGAFRKLIGGVEERGDKIVYVSFDWHLGLDPDWGYKNGEDALEVMLHAERRAQRNGTTIFADDVMCNAHSSDIEACGRIIRRFYEATGK